MQKRLGTAIAAAAVGLALASPVRAQDQSPERFKHAIDAFVARLGPSTNGLVKWAGSDPYEVRRDGDSLVAIVDHALLKFAAPEIDKLTLDRIEIRQVGEKEGGKLIELAILLPTELALKEADGTETRMSLQEARAHAVVDATTGRGRESSVAFAGARIEQLKTGAWIGFGPLSMTSKFADEAGGGWSAPVTFELKDVEFFFPQGSVGGTIDRIAYNGKAAGPKREQIERLRDAVDALQTEDSKGRDQRLAAFLALLPTLPGAFSTIRFEAGVDGLNVRGTTGEPMLSLAKAGVSGAISGLDGDLASIRIGVRHDGLDIAPSVLDKDKQPRRVVVDLGLADLNTDALRKLIEAAGKTLPGAGAAASDEQQKEAATQQMLAAAAMLNPTFRVYDLALDTDQVGVDLTGEIKGSPLSPKGYSAAGDVVLRGVEAIPRLGAGVPFADYLPVLEQLGREDRTADGTPRLKLHLVSTPQQRLAINDNDVGAWFDDAVPRPGQPRLLKPADPPLQGNDVRAVQRALAAASIAAAQDGVYDPATAAAVARYQKREGINISGVVDAATRQKLGVAAVPAGPEQRN
jgi:hypothetical protein